MNYFHLINQHYKRLIIFPKREAILIISNEKTNGNFGMEMGKTPGKRIKKKNIDSLISNNFLFLHIIIYINQKSVKKKYFPVSKYLLN